MSRKELLARLLSCLLQTDSLTNPFFTEYGVKYKTYESEKISLTKLETILREMAGTCSLLLEVLEEENAKDMAFIELSRRENAEGES